MKKPSNQEVIEKYLNHYRHSIQSLKMRDSSLNYFFGENHFNYIGHIFDISTSTLIDYFDYLKNLDSVSFQTRKNKWHILASLLNFSMEYWNSKGLNFLVKIPSKTIDWKGHIPKKEKNNSNSKVFATKEEIKKILLYLKESNFKHYLIMRLFNESGMRKGELINCKVSEVDLEKRHIHLHMGKTGEKIYPFTPSFKALLEIYLKEREKIESMYDNLFLTRKLTPYGNRFLNILLRKVCKRVKITKQITTKTFRKTLNDYRKEMGCSNEDRKLLLGHAVRDVNFEHYTRSDLTRHIELYDQWYPYQKIKF